MLPTVIQWRNKKPKPQCPIYANIYIKFTSTISLGISHYVNGKNWSKLLTEETNEIHWTGPIWRSAYKKLPKVFELWEKSIVDYKQIPMFCHLFLNVQRFMELMSIYSQHCFEGGIEDERIKRLKFLHPQSFISDLKMLPKMVPYLWIGYLGMFPSMLEKIKGNSHKHGLIEASTTKGESLHRYLKEAYTHANHDWDDIVKIANISDLRKMDLLTNEKFDVDKFVKCLQKNKDEIWTDEIESSFTQIEANFKEDTKLILEELRNHDWVKDPNIPPLTTAYKYGRKHNQNIRNKKRQLNANHNGNANKRRR
eukprot:310999_1